jgi:hypothetical protein
MSETLMFLVASMMRSLQRDVGVVADALSPDTAAAIREHAPSALP